MNKLIVLTSYDSPYLADIHAIFSDHCKIAVVTTLEQLCASDVDRSTRLLSFGSGVIVPAKELSRFGGLAYNLHSASPRFPGRDPHHHAIYQNAAEYGATLHVMSEAVDTGPIVAVELFPVPPGNGPQELLKLANEAGLRLLRRVSSELLSPLVMPKLPDIEWGTNTTKRNDLVRMSQINCLIGEEEFCRRYSAYDGGSYDNLYTVIHGKKFRIEKSETVDRPVEASFLHFTEAAFVALVRMLKSANYSFEKFGHDSSGRHVLWRHDVDISMHRALALARLERREHVSGTYFINPKAAFYNIFESNIASIVREIKSLGHDIGLHFDGSAEGVSNWCLDDLELAIAKQKALLESVLGSRIDAISWHNPDMSNLLEFQQENIAGLKNAYSQRIRRDYVYCSDSNGYWRFKPMGKVIEEGADRLHLLTHPEWWTVDPMSPSKKIDRALIGRARSGREQYDMLIKKAGRENLDD